MKGKMTWSSVKEFFNLYYEHNKYLPILYKKIKNTMEKELLDLKKNLQSENEDEED